MSGTVPCTREDFGQVPHMTQAELARLWRVTTRTLDRWRVEGKGPAWMRVNGRILYRVVDVRAYEVRRLRHPKD